MIQVTIEEAQRRLPELLAMVQAGEGMEIYAESGWIFQLTVQPAAPAINPDWPGYPHAGSAKGLIEVPDNFDEPLEELKEYME